MSSGVLQAAIIGASGYSGVELLRLLSFRHDVCITHAVAASSAGKRVDELYPSFAGRTGLRYEPFDPEVCAESDIVFLALPSGEAMRLVPQLVDRRARIIDLGGDYRLGSASVYEQFYQHSHSSPHLLGRAVYGLPELHREAIASAELVANPGCYPTSAILGLLPALSAGFILPAGIAINSLSGISGAGRSASVDLSFSEVNENIRAYKLGTHQHIPEIESVLGRATGKPVTVSFVPHLVPITRGIYTTIHASLQQGASETEILEWYRTFYCEAPFVRIKEHIPQIKDVFCTNFCDMYLKLEPRTHQLIIISVIDNLVKGAAGQAMQNMNIMFGKPQEAGLL